MRQFILSNYTIFDFNEPHHGVHHRNLACLGDIIDTKSGGSEEPRFNQSGTGCPLQQREIGGHPFLSDEEGDIGDRGIAQIAVFDNKDVVARSAMLKEFIKTLPIGVFERIDDIVAVDELERRDFFRGIGVIFDFISIAAVQKAAAVDSSLWRGDEGVQLKRLFNPLLSTRSVQPLLMVAQMQRFARFTADGFE